MGHHKWNRETLDQFLSDRPHELEHLLELSPKTAVRTDNLALLCDLGVDREVAKLGAMVLGWFGVALHPADLHVAELAKGACPECAGDVLISTTYRGRCLEDCAHTWHGCQGDRGQCRQCQQWYRVEVEEHEGGISNDRIFLVPIKWPEER